MENASVKMMEGKTALVTGAGSGIGRATAKLLAGRGVFVGCLDRDPEHTAAIVNEIEAEEGRAVGLAADVTDHVALQDAIQQLISKSQRLDAVVANVGINGVWAPIEEMLPQEWENTIRTNLTGTFLTLRAAIPHLKQHGGGSIVIVSSVNGNRVFSNAGACAYASSKAAQVALGRMLALELAPANVRVNTICPGSINTNIESTMERRDLEQIKPNVIYPDGVIPLNNHQPGKAEQVAELILFLISPAAAHITGTEVFIDGAESLLMG